LTLFESITKAAEAESPVWAASLRAIPDVEPVFSPLVPPELALGLETIYEAYLVHYGRPRLFEATDADDAILLGDYLYAHGLVHIATAGGVPAVVAMAELIARCSAERADGRPDDGAAWVEASHALGGQPDADAVARALATHSARVAT
jgi:hypothetical protein